MTWLQEILPTNEQQRLLETADQAFAAICQGDTFAADTYRVHPDIKVQDWKAIRENLVELSASEPSELPQRLRARLASMVESLVRDHFYANLRPSDREIYAKWLGSSREKADRTHDVSTTHDFAYASVLEFVICNGWASNGLGVEDLAALQKVFIDCCTANCDQEFAIARAHARGQELSDAEKQRSETILSRKEAARRAIAGEDEIAT